MPGVPCCEVDIEEWDVELDWRRSRVDSQASGSFTGGLVGQRQAPSAMLVPGLFTGTTTSTRDEYG